MRRPLKLLHRILQQQSQSYNANYAKSFPQKIPFTRNVATSSRSSYNTSIFPRVFKRGSLTESSVKTTEKRWNAILKTRGLFRNGVQPFSGRSFSTSRPRLNQQAQAEAQSLSARLRKLSREYGWSAFGIYMALSALDFPFCFLAVQYVGAETIGKYEHAIVEWVKRAIPINWPGKARSVATAPSDVEAVGMAPEGYDHGFKEAEKENRGNNASIWTKLALAYAIHKSFIFIRVPATVAVTPKVVKTLRGWGWNIGKRTPKAEREARRAEIAAKKSIEGGVKGN